MSRKVKRLVITTETRERVFLRRTGGESTPGENWSGVPDQVKETLSRDDCSVAESGAADAESSSQEKKKL